MSKLAINGGSKIRTKKFPPYRTMGKEEKQAVCRVIDSGVLSKFIGSWHEDFYGGIEVKNLEKEWSEYFNVKHSIAVNSATSALFCAIGAAGIGPGDEVIVPAYTFPASAIAPLIYNAIPVFADIEEDYFCVSYASIKEKITQRTKAIIVVDLFGQSYDVEKINSLAKEYNLLVIEDCAQAQGAKYKDKFAGTSGDIGIYSLNSQKHINCGEGGILVTNNDILADKVRMIRNHAEAVVEGRNFRDLTNMIGFNYRMTELEAAVTREQLKKLSYLVDERINNIEYLNKKLLGISCLEVAKVRPQNVHSYGVHPIKFNKNIASVHRNKFVDALKAELMPIELRESEGVRISSGYIKPLYLQPIYQEKIAYGKLGCPWTCPLYKGKVSYEKGICPTAEKMHEDTLIVHELMRPGMSKNDLDDVADAFEKVWNNIDELK